MLLSAVLIVRDEAHCIGPCLASVQGVADEIVVVDTGSLDDTRALALAGGGRVFDFAWCDDFSAARNYALDQARGSWILYIDADEQLRPYPRARLERELAEPGLAGATVRFHPRSGYTAYREYRLFRRDPRIRFSGAMHETIVPALDKLVAEGGSIGASDLTIDHFGYDGDQSHKLGRNLALLTKELSRDPGRVYLWWHLGTVERDLGRHAEAEAAWQEGLRRGRLEAPPSSGVALCVSEMAKTRLARGEECADLLAEGLALAPDDRFLWWLQARALAEQGAFEPAMAIFRELATLDPTGLIGRTAYDRRIFGAGAWAELGYCAFRLGRYRESELHYREAERLDPDSLEFRAKRVLAAARATRP